MSRNLMFALLAASIPLIIDYYVFRNWRRFAKPRPRLRWTVPVYRVFMAVMPFTMPIYTVSSRWWDVEPKLFRACFVGFWITYYLPKVLVALVLLIKDALLFVGWLFGWFQQRLAPAPVEPTTPAAPDTASLLDLTDIKHSTRRQFLQTLGWSTATIPFVLVGYSVFRTLYDFEIHRIDVPVAGLPRSLDGMTVAQISDLHAGSFFSEKPMDEAVALVQSLQADLIVITGDFVNHDAAEMRLIGTALQRLHADLGVYGCLGNHDHYARVDEVIGLVRNASVDLMVNEGRTLAIDDARLHLIGTDNTGFYQDFANLPRALKDLDLHPHGDDFRILLSHTPTYWDTHVRPGYPDIDLMLCGHTHGGQIGFELGPLRYSLARVAYARWAGLYDEPRADNQGRQYLYVNRGVGTIGPPLRLGIRPEITLLTLRRASTS